MRLVNPVGLSYTSPMALFKKTKTKKQLSVPVGDDLEARWKREEVIPFTSSSDLWGGAEGELALDVYLSDRTVTVRTALAGVSPEDVSIALHNDLLTIRGQRREEELVEADHYVVQECHWGSFSRSVVLPVPVTSEGAEAVMKNGILKIMLYRAAPASVNVQVTRDELGL